MCSAPDGYGSIDRQKNFGLLRVLAHLERARAGPERLGGGFEGAGLVGLRF